MEVIVFIILVTFCSETCCSTRLFEDGQIWGGKGVGRPAKVIIDEIITRSITFPAPKARQTNDRSTFDQNRWGEGFNGKRYGQEQFYLQSPQLLTPNRRQEDNSNTENSLQFDEDDIVVLEQEDGTQVPLEKTIHLIAEAPASSSSPDGGIHIHVQEKALNAFFDKIPWEDLMDSFNNKLTQKHEIRQVREHIFTDADQKATFDHSGWNDFGQEQTRVASNSYRPKANSNTKRTISSGNHPIRSWNNYGKPTYYSYNQRKSDDRPVRKQKPTLCSTPSYHISRQEHHFKSIDC